VVRNSKRNKNRNDKEIRTMTDKDVVIGAYPKSECREITSPSGSYYMIYDLAGPAPNLIGMDMEKEDSAWKMARQKIGEKMVKILEKE
jgi:hypothetical protein